ncbi:MAG: MurR/RpiR family transcriptional regulator [Lachnospiraceae bacterium]|nr:MurR/RpiR family transcriptional regulator [Lachnospiraceae bacterium]
MATIGDEKRDLISVMNEQYPRMSKNHKKIASYIVDHYENAVFMTAAKLGKQLGISESTVVRFASGLGFDGYPQFQKELEKWVQGQWNNSVHRIGVQYRGSSQSEIFDSVLRADMDKIADTIQNLDERAFELAVDTILEAKHVYVIGLRSCEPLANFLSFYLSMIRGDVIRLQTTSMSELFEQMIRISNEDAIIGISFPRYSMRTLKALEFANDRNAKVITLTDTIHSPMNLYSSCNLLARSDMVSIVDSLVAPLSVINALVVALCVKAPAQARKSLEELEYAWANYQVYLNDEINFINDEPVLDSPLMQELKQ